MKRKLLVLVDYSYLCFRAIFVYQRYVSKERGSAMLFVQRNIIEQWKNMRYEVETKMEQLGYDKEDIVYLFCEDRAPNNPRKQDTMYKKHRNNVLIKDFTLYIEGAKEEIKRGHRVYFQYDPRGRLEADDVAANYVRMLQRHNLKNRLEIGWDCLLVSADEDWGVFARFEEYFSSYLLRLKSVSEENRLIKNTIEFEKEFKVPYNTLLLKKALCGDRSDGVKGVSSFGLKAFQQFLDYIKSFDSPTVDVEEMFERCCVANSVVSVLENYLVSFLDTEKPRGFANKNLSDLFESLKEANKSLKMVRPMFSGDFKLPLEIQKDLITNTKDEEDEVDTEVDTDDCSDGSVENDLSVTEISHKAVHNDTTMW